jgi:hypothetical protein
MIKFLLILALGLSLNASKILSYNVYDRTDRVDVMITFDTPYDGVIKKSVSNSEIIIKLQDASIESKKSQQLSSKFLNSLTITTVEDDTNIVASIPPSTILQASKTSDGYGLRLRFSAKDTVKTKEKTTIPNNPFAELPTKKDDGMQKNYYIVIAILIIGVLILLYIKIKVTPKNKPNKKNSWLFKANQENMKNESAKKMDFDKNVSIRFQKNIDSENSVVMLDFGDQSYLVIMGKTNILLDKFIDNKPATQDDFEVILQNRHQELNSFIETQESNHNTLKEPLQAYKERAAGFIYDS